MGNSGSSPQAPAEVPAQLQMVQLPARFQVSQALRGARAGEPARALPGNSQTLPQRNTQ